MKKVYANIAPATGPHEAGICSLYVAPREWLDKDPPPFFETGVVINAVQLQDSKFWIRFDLLEDSYMFEEAPKNHSAGAYRLTNIQGTLNFYNFELQQKLHTLGQHDLVAIVKDTNRRQRLIGSTTNAMALSYTHKIQNSPAREDRIEVSLSYASEQPPPFYNPTGEPEIIYNFLEDIGGNFLLIG